MRHQEPDPLQAAIEAASNDPRRVAPEFEWVLKGNQWVATNRRATKNRFGAQPRRVVVTPGKPGIYVHGGETLTWLAFLNGGSQPRGDDFKHCLAELCRRVGMETPRPRSAATTTRSPAVATEVPIEPIPSGSEKRYRDVWPLSAAERIHRYPWGLVVKPTGRKVFIPCRPSSIGLIIGTRTGTYAWREGAWRSPKGSESQDQLRGIPGVNPQDFTTYRAKEVAAAIAESRAVWMCEGEKDVEALEKLGAVADTNPGGAGKLTREQAQVYRGAVVALIPDNDQPDETGRSAGVHGATINARTLLAAGALEVRILEPLEPPKGYHYSPGYDVTDFIGHRLQNGTEPAEILNDLEIRRAHAPIFTPESLQQTERSLKPASASLKPASASLKPASASEVAADVVNDAFELIELTKTDPDAIYGIRTGIPTLDDLTLGLHPGLIILAAPPSMGKTTLAQSIALHACKSDRVLYLSWEHTAKSLTRRMLCSHAGVDTMQLRRGRIEPKTLIEAHNQLAPRLSRLDIIETDPGLTIDVLRELLGDRASGRVLMVLDFLQLHAKTSREFRDIHDARGKVDALSGELLSLAHSHDLPILAISSQARGGDGYNAGKGSANLSTLKESGDTEYTADLVMVLTRPDDDEAPKGERVLHLKKHREGPTGQIPLVMDLRSGQGKREGSQATNFALKPCRFTREPPPASSRPLAARPGGLQIAPTSSASSSVIPGDFRSHRQTEPRRPGRPRARPGQRLFALDAFRSRRRLRPNLDDLVGLELALGNGSSRSTPSDRADVSDRTSTTGDPWRLQIAPTDRTSTTWSASSSPWATALRARSPLWAKRHFAAGSSRLNQVNAAEVPHLPGLSPRQLKSRSFTVGASGGVVLHRSFLDRAYALLVERSNTTPLAISALRAPMVDHPRAPRGDGPK